MAVHRPIKVGDQFTCKCGTVVTVARYIDTNSIEVVDAEGNKRATDGFQLRRGLKWRKMDGSLYLVGRSIKEPIVATATPLTAPYMNESASENYVYIVTVLGEVVYVGYGKGNRYRHTISGKSTSKELNRLYFANAPMITEIVANGLDRKSAQQLEKTLIAKHKPKCNEVVYALET